jgi:hypothetical protein
MTKLSPLESEFETTEEEAAYEAWLRAKIGAVIAKDGPKIPHDEVMAEMRELIEQKYRDAASRMGD